MLSPYGPAARSDPPGASCNPLLPSGFGSSGVSLDPPACPPVPLVSLGSYSSMMLWPAAAVPPSRCVIVPSVRYLYSLAVAHACMCVCQSPCP
jgi:hypothetical protein